MYFSVVTITTLGYGDNHLTEKAWIGQLIVVCQLLVAVYFVSTVFAVVATWTNAPLAAPPILELKDAVPQKALKYAVERAGRWLAFARRGRSPRALGGKTTS